MRARPAVLGTASESCRGLSALLLGAVALASASCGGQLMRLPSGAGDPAADALSALDEATSACRAVRTLTAEISVSGSVGGRRVRARLSAGVAAPASARLEAVAPFGQPLFIFVATGGEATLLLPRDGRVLQHGRPDAVLEAVAGAPLDAEALRETITGCAAESSAALDARRFGDAWRVVAAKNGGALYLHREGSRARWRLVAVVARVGSGRSWRAEYRDFRDDLPRTVRLASTDAHVFDLRLALSQVETNVPLGPDVFRVHVPASAHPITLDELRGSGPMRLDTADDR